MNWAGGKRENTRKEVLSSGDLHQPNSSLKSQFAQVLRLRYFTLKGWKPKVQNGRQLTMPLFLFDVPGIGLLHMRSWT